MPKIKFDGQLFDCPAGANLRQILRTKKLPLYNGVANAIHCRGLGTCGTCAVRVHGKVSPPTRIEKWRLNFPPHRASQGLRLACQCQVEGDLEVTKLDGLWGNQGE